MLILVARRDDRLQTLKKELEEEHKVSLDTAAMLRREHAMRQAFLLTSL